MRADITRNTFLEANRHSRVLLQQGRVQLDADFNEQVSILLHYLQGLASDIIGPYGGPCGDCAFQVLSQAEINQKGGQWGVSESIRVGGNDFLISMGRYYVDGIACEVDHSVLYREHAENNGLTVTAKDIFPAFVYLDVWERLLTSVESPSIREVALGGPDTAVRTQIVWQVKIVPHKDWTEQVGDPSAEDEAWYKYWNDQVNLWQPTNRGTMRAMCQNPAENAADDPCIIPPDNRYRGTENQLYRVEIHQGGLVADGAAFKWSRDNGSVVFPIRKTQGDMVFLEHLGRDITHFSLNEGDWVEIVDDQYELAGADVEFDITESTLRPLFQVAEVDRMARRVKVKLPTGGSLPAYDEKSTSHPLLRRWDHRFNPANKDTWRDDKTQHEGIRIQEGSWLPLENGIQVYFEPNATYRRGDYWLIPARTLTGDIEWRSDPTDPTKKAALPPHGVEHHYAPLALIDADGLVVHDLRRKFNGLAQVNVCTTDRPVVSASEQPQVQGKNVAKDKASGSTRKKK
jgi:hypothetical protein